MLNCVKIGKSDGAEGFKVLQVLQRQTHQWCGVQETRKRSVSEGILIYRMFVISGSRKQWLVQLFRLVKNRGECWWDRRFVLWWFVVSGRFIVAIFRVKQEMVKDEDDYVEEVNILTCRAAFLCWWKIICSSPTKLNHLQQTIAENWIFLLKSSL